MSSVIPSALFPLQQKVFTARFYRPAEGLFFPFPCFGGGEHTGWGFVTVTLEKLAAVKCCSLK